MSERKLFWIGLAGGVITIFGLLILVVTAYVAIASVTGGDWRPVALPLPYALFLYLFGVALKTLSEMGTKVNELERDLVKARVIQITQTANNR